MKKAALIFSLFILSFFFLISCGEKINVQRLSVEKGKKFEKFNFKKIGEFTLWAGWCLATPYGVVCCEYLDRQRKECELSLFDYSGQLIKNKKLTCGDGPHEIKRVNFERVWLSSSGKVFCNDDNNYLKAIDPQTLEIGTIAKFSNVIEGYSKRYTFGRHSFTSLETFGNRTVTSFESPGYYIDLTYYIVTYNNVFDDFSVLAAVKKETPLSRSKSFKERKFYVDYYSLLRLERILSVDWKRNVVYYFRDIEKPEIESVDFEGKRKEKLYIDIDYKKYKVERKEFDWYYEYVLSDTDKQSLNLIEHILYLPPHAPPIMQIKVTNDLLLIIIGNRNYDKGENELLVYRLPSLKYEGSLFIPFPNIQRIKWYDNYFIIKKLIEKEDGYYTTHEIYMIEEK